MPRSPSPISCAWSAMVPDPFMPAAQRRLGRRELIVPSCGIGAHEAAGANRRYVARGSERFEAAQYLALQTLCPALAGVYPIRHIAGHEHIAPGRKADPGAGLDWALLRRQLGFPAAFFPEFLD